MSLQTQITTSASRALTLGSQINRSEKARRKNKPQMQSLYSFGFTTHTVRIGGLSNKLSIETPDLTPFIPSGSPAHCKVRSSFCAWIGWFSLPRKECGKAMRSSGNQNLDKSDFLLFVVASFFLKKSLLNVCITSQAFSEPGNRDDTPRSNPFLSTQPTEFIVCSKVELLFMIFSCTWIF